MTPSIQIQETMKRLERARAYLELMEDCKRLYRSHKRDELHWQAQGILHMSGHYRGRAERMEHLHRYLTDRYNNTVAESLIIAPHMIETN